MSIKDRLIQFVLRGKDELSPEAKKSAAALEALAQEATALGSALDNAKGAQGLVGSLRQTQRAVEQAERALVQGDLQIKELREALDRAPGSEGLQQSLQAAEREARRTQKQLANLTDQLREQEQAAQAAGVDTTDLAAEQRRLAAEVERARAAVKGNAEATRELERAQARAGREAAEHASRIGAVRDAMSSGARQVLGFAAAYISLNAAFNLAQKGLSLVSSGIKSMFASGSDEEQALAQLEAALASTGHAAGLTAQQLRDMAESIGRDSLLTGEQILAAQTRLLSYTDIAGTEFPRALQLVIDQQQRLGISAEQSAEIVGRALQSPAEAMATLGRQGFKFTEQQKRMLLQLERTGDKAKAQAVIMDMMTEAYGGAAAAARMGTFKGLLKTIGDQFDDFGKKVSASGAFEYVKRRLLEVSQYIDGMAADGRLDRLAKSLSDAFIQGIEWVERFGKSLLDVDFKTFSQDSAQWLSGFGRHLDEAAQKVSLFILPFRSLFNGITSGLSVAVLGVTSLWDTMLQGLEKVAQALPDAVGGETLRKAIAERRAELEGLTKGFQEQIEQDGKDLEDALKRGLDSGVDAAQEAAAARAAAAEEAAAAEKAAAADAAAEQEKLRAQMLRTFIDGKAVIYDVAKAVELIQTAKTRDELEGLRTALRAAFDGGMLSMDDYSKASALLEAQLRKLGGQSSAAGDAVADLASELKDLADVQRAIGTAQTDQDLSRIRRSISQMYSEGSLTAQQYNEAMKQLAVRQRELKGAVEQGARAQTARTNADKEALVTSEQLRRESGKRMEAERRAGQAAMEARRKGSEDAKKDMAGVADYFSGVMSRAREPLAALSAAALAAYDRLRGISAVQIEVDTSSLDATRQSLARVTDQLAQLQQAAALPGMTALGRWQLDTQAKSLEVQQAFLGQKSSLQSLMQQYERGALSARQFVNTARGMKAALSLLDDSDLSALEGAIAAAEQRMQQMAQTTRSTLESLQDELDGLEGRTEDIERRRFAARQRELQAQLAEAQAGGDAQAVANASRALGMLRQIESASAQQRQAEQQKARQEEIAKAKEAPAATAAGAPAKVIRLEVPGRPAVDVAVGSNDDETKLLDILASAGLRAL